MKNTSTHSKSAIKIAQAIAIHIFMVLLCAWFALCTSIGPIFRSQDYKYISHNDDLVFASIANFRLQHFLIFIISFALYYFILCVIIHFGKTYHLPNHIIRFAQKFLLLLKHISSFVLKIVSKLPHTNSQRFLTFLRTGKKALNSLFKILYKFARACIIHMTRTRKNIMITLFVGWLWIPVTLLAAYGADICSQIREYSWAWNQVTGLKQPYIGFFSFVPADIYPTAHYLWPTHPTYLTDQHNIVLTVIYGSVTAVSRYFTDSNDAGIVLLAALQFLFAIWCCSASANRFLNQPWNNSIKDINQTGITSSTDDGTSAASETSETSTQSTPISANTTSTPVFIRLAILITFLFSPLVTFSTISLTKSPLFAFAFVWWFGTLYELRNKNYRYHTIFELIISVCVMLIAAKYAWYILIIQFVILLISERKRWCIWVCCILLPIIAIHGSISLLIHNGVIISGDPIESKGLQLQQIARTARLNPKSIPYEARKDIEPIFNLDQTAETYNPQDADPVKSSGLQSKKVSYRWRYVTKKDLQKFNRAWWLIVTNSPLTAIDAFLAKTYGYFDITDKPYVGPEYYINTDNIQNSTWIRYWMPDWRNKVYRNASDFSDNTELGWLIHGNTYVIATLLIGAAEIICKRWKTVALHIPLALLVGVMMLAPANNFERHMLPITFVFWFTALTFWKESQSSKSSKYSKEPQLSNKESQSSKYSKSSKEPKSIELNTKKLLEENKMPIEKENGMNANKIEETSMLTTNNKVCND